MKLEEDTKRSIATAVAKYTYYISIESRDFGLYTENREARGRKRQEKRGKIFEKGDEQFCASSKIHSEIAKTHPLVVLFPPGRAEFPSMIVYVPVNMYFRVEHTTGGCLSRILISGQSPSFPLTQVVMSLQTLCSLRTMYYFPRVIQLTKI